MERMTVCENNLLDQCQLSLNQQTILCHVTRGSVTSRRVQLEDCISQGNRQFHLKRSYRRLLRSVVD